jgi:hypothetical protein
MGIIRDINGFFTDAEALSCKAFMENCCACLTGYLLLLCMPTHYEKVRFFNQTCFRFILHENI